VSDVYVHTLSAMSTVVTMQVVGHGANARQQQDRATHVARAAKWFEQIERCCTRFDARSEARRLTEHVGAPVPVSDILFETVRFALALAEETNGAFDPTIGHHMAARGFDREHRTGNVAAPLDASDSVSYRDVEIDPINRTIALRRALVLDLGAVAKGFAIDMAARELEPLENFAIDAGGDLFLGGCNEHGKSWTVGIRHPRDVQQLLDTLQVSGMAVCTSGDYERATDAGHHIVDPQTHTSAALTASATVIAPVAMVADGLATAAFVLGPARGIELLERHGVQGLIVTPQLERFATS
jgi:thiamine biosynthesis lipoprotein